MARKKSSFWGEVGAASIGVAVGSVLGMLISPNSGKTNRRLVKKEATKVAGSVKRSVKKTVSAVQKSAAPHKRVVKKSNKHK